MEELIVSIISLIILVPIIYFLPLGLTHKGKGLLILIAFVFANLGLMVKSSLPAWQAGGIILLLIVLTVYILDRKFSKLLYANGKAVEEDEEEEIRVENALVELEEKLLVEDNPVGHEEDSLPDTRDSVLVTEREEEKILVEIHSPSESEEDLLSLDESSPFDEEVQIDELVKDIIETAEDVDLEEIEFSWESAEITEDTDGTKQEEELPVDSYMSEIEQLIDDVDVEEEYSEVSQSEENVEESIMEEVDDVESDVLVIVEDVLISGKEDESLASEEPIVLNDESIPDPEEELSAEDYMSELEQLIEGTELEEEQLEASELEVVELHTEDFDEVELEELVLIDEKESEVSAVETQDGLVEETIYDLEPDELTEELTFSELNEDVIPELAFNENKLLVEIIEDASDNEIKFDLGKSSPQDNESVQEATEEQESILLNELNHAQSEAAVSLELVTEEPVLEDEPEQVESIEEKFLPDEEENVTDTASELETEEVTVEEILPEKKETQKSVLQQQLFHTMVSQLHLARKHMKADEYEQYINEHLLPELPAQDYYTFATLLIEHYISKKDLVKLQELLTDLRGKFTRYPILDMEIQFLYKQYCEKTR